MGLLGRLFWEPLIDKPKSRRLKKEPCSMGRFAWCPSRPEIRHEPRGRLACSATRNSSERLRLGCPCPQIRQVRIDQSIDVQTSNDTSQNLGCAQWATKKRLKRPPCHFRAHEQKWGPTGSSRKPGSNCLSCSGNKQKWSPFFGLKTLLGISVGQPPKKKTWCH